MYLSEESIKGLETLDVTLDGDKDEKNFLKNWIWDILAQLKPRFPSFDSSEVNSSYGAEIHQ